MKLKDSKEYKNILSKIKKSEVNNSEQLQSLKINNIGISSLEGIPKIIRQYLKCNNNKITSFKGCEDLKILGKFDCSYNKLTSLEGFPYVGSAINVSNNELTSLKHLPTQVKGYLHANNNKLTSLKDFPEKINGELYLEGNDLQTLEGSLRKAQHVISLRKNPNLKNVKDQIIKNQIKCMRYFTDEGDFYFKEIKEEFEKYGLYLREKNKQLKNNIVKQEIIIKTRQKTTEDYGLGI